MDRCILCKSSKKDDIQYGEFLQNKQMAVHTFCLYLSSNLLQNGNDDEGFLGFLPADIEKEVNRISHLKCCYCSKRYANIGCCGKKCRRTFHLVCGLDHNSQHQFSHDFRSYCNRHAKKVAEKPSYDETCLICYELLSPVDKKLNTANVILTPCCRNGWFHKICLQKFAKTAGYFFKCPLCNDAETFREELPAQGIFIPNQDAAWELEPNAYAELLERPSECCAENCKNKKGRESTSHNNSFLICITCGSKAIHSECLSNDDKQYRCGDCTVAFVEDDSGRESLNLHVKENNDDEYVDVCHVSDEEDRLIVKLVELNNTKSEKKRDSGSHTDTSVDEIAHSTRNLSRTTRISKNKDMSSLCSKTNIRDTLEKQKCRSRDSSTSDGIKPIALRQTRNIRCEPSGADTYETDSRGSHVVKPVSSDADAIKPVALRQVRRVRSEPSTSSATKSVALTPTGRIKSDSGSSEAVTLTSKSSICSDSSSDDDIKPVALRQERYIGSEPSGADASETDSKGSYVVKSVALNRNRVIRSVSTDADAMKPVSLRKARHVRSDPSASSATKSVGLTSKSRVSSASSNADDIKPVGLRQTRRIGSESSGADTSETDSRSSYVVKPVPLNRNRVIRSVSSDADSIKPVVLRQTRRIGSDSSASGGKKFVDLTPTSRIRTDSRSPVSSSSEAVALTSKSSISSASSNADDIKPVALRQTRRICSESSGADTSETDSRSSYVVKPVALNRNRVIRSESRDADSIKPVVLRQTRSNGSDSDCTKSVVLRQTRRIGSDSSASDVLKSVALTPTNPMGSDSSNSEAVALTSKRSTNSVSRIDAAIKPVAVTLKRCISTDSSDSDTVKTVISKQKSITVNSNIFKIAETSQDRCRKIKRCEKEKGADVNSTDSGNGEMNDNYAVAEYEVISKRFPSNSTNIEYNECIKLRRGNVNSPDIFNDSDSDYERMSDLKGFPITQKGLHRVTSNNRSEANSTDTDDPLDLFPIFLEKKNDISCIALRTRKSNSLKKQKCFTRKENEKNYVNVCNNEVHQGEKDLQKKQTTRSQFVNTKSLQNVANNVTRTRRKTISNNSSSQINNKKKEHVNSLNVSCIALRTRRKTICGRTEYTKKLHDEPMEVIEAEQGADTEMKSSDISCIANRTRKRKRLKTTPLSLSEIDENFERNSSGPSSSQIVNKNRSRRDHLICSC